MSHVLCVCVCAADMEFNVYIQRMTEEPDDVLASCRELTMMAAQGWVVCVSVWEELSYWPLRGIVALMGLHSVARGARMDSLGPGRQSGSSHCVRWSLSEDFSPLNNVPTVWGFSSDLWAPSSPSSHFSLEDVRSETTRKTSWQSRDAPSAYNKYCLGKSLKGQFTQIVKTWPWIYIYFSTSDIHAASDIRTSTVTLFMSHQKVMSSVSSWQ